MVLPANRGAVCGARSSLNRTSTGEKVGPGVMGWAPRSARGLEGLWMRGGVVGGRGDGTYLFYQGRWRGTFEAETGQPPRRGGLDSGAAGARRLWVRRSPVAAESHQSATPAPARRNWIAFHDLAREPMEPSEGGRTNRSVKNSTVTRWQVAPHGNLVSDQQQLATPSTGQAPPVEHKVDARLFFRVPFLAP